MRRPLLESVLALAIVVILAGPALRALWRPAAQIPEISPAWPVHQEDTLHPY